MAAHPPDVLMLTTPQCHICGEVMRPEPEEDPPDPISDPPSESNERFVNTEAWVDDWWREAGTG